MGERRQKHEGSEDGEFRHKNEEAEEEKALSDKIVAGLWQIKEKVEGMFGVCWFKVKCKMYI